MRVPIEDSCIRALKLLGLGCRSLLNALNSLKPAVVVPGNFRELLKKGYLGICNIV